MATNKLKSGKAEIEYLTNVTSGVDTYGRVIKDPTTSTVRIFVVARSSSDMTGNTVLARIPEGLADRGQLRYRQYRPEAFSGLALSLRSMTEALLLHIAFRALALTELVRYLRLTAYHQMGMAMLLLRQMTFR